MRLVSGIVIAGLAALAAAQPQYEVVDLTKMFGTDFTAVDINNYGAVVGHMRLTHSTDQACVIQNGELTMLPMYQGIHPWYAIGIGDNGDVLGAGTLGTGTYRSIVYRNGKVIDIGIPGFQEFPASFGMSDTGQVTGFMNNTPFVWDSGNVTVIPGGGSGHAINGALQVAGTRQNRATTWVNGQPIDLHPAWAEGSFAASINKTGEIAGWGRRITGGQRGVLWRNGKAIDLGDFGGGQSRAYDVNDLSQVVGWASMAGQPDEGFLWDKGTLYRLEDLMLGGSGFQLVQTAEALNNGGQILASGFTGSANHEILLNPVPEPASILLLAGAICGLAISRRRGRRG
jgi:uncharacterized membrane protein